MFWKKTPDSLAARLSVWYAVSAFLLLMAATGSLYWLLVQSFNREDDQSLWEKVNTLSTLLRKGDFRTIQWEVEGEARVRPSVDVFSRVIAPGGKVLMESSGMADDLPARVFPPLGSVDFRAAEGRVFRVLAEQAPAGYVVQVGLEVTFERNLLGGYRRKLYAILGLGLLLAALIGYWIARRGIRPVEEIARTVRRIRSTTLDERLATAGLPAELAALASTFNEMLDRLEEGFGRLARFSSDIAHELRTPVNNLRGEVEVALSRARAPEEYREVLGSALEECLRLSRLIDSLLFLARAEHPETQIHRERVEVERELAAVREFYEAAAAEAGVSLSLEAPEGIAAELDRTLFQRAVGNLIENALAYTPRGGRIGLRAARENGTVLVSVWDTGCGIPPEHVPHVFDRFYRVDSSRSKHNGGAGLGLAIVKSVAALHGGTARLESEPGGGTRVTLAFPAEEEAADMRRRRFETTDERR